MQGGNLLAKLNEGDMTATEAKYHKNRLTNMYSKFKGKQKKCSGSEGTIINYRKYLYTIFKLMCT